MQTKLREQREVLREVQVQVRAAAEQLEAISRRRRERLGLTAKHDAPVAQADVSAGGDNDLEKL
jgi:hypothetical protein